MKEIKAVIRPNKLAILRDALVALPGFPGMTVSKVEGCSASSRASVSSGSKLCMSQCSLRCKLATGAAFSGGSDSTCTCALQCRRSRPSRWACNWPASVSCWR